MEIGGSPHTGDGDEATTVSNVVRLPRDWLGPREDLIPFGTNDLDDAPAPPRAEDFWGESSAAVQDAWGGPAEEGATPEREADPAEHAPHDAVARRAGLGRRLVALAPAAVLVAVLAAGVVAIVAEVLTSGHHALVTRLASDPGHRSSRTVGASHRPASVVSRKREPATVHRRPAVLGGSVAVAAHQAVFAAQAGVNRWRVTAARQRAARAASTHFVSRGTGVVPTTGNTPAATYSPPPTASAPQSSTPSPGPTGPGAVFGPGRIG